MKRIGLLILVLFSANSYAGEWTQPLTVKDIAYYKHPPLAPVTIRVTFNEAPTTSSCETSIPIATYIATSPDGFDARWLSMLLSAQAQNKKVKLFIQNCSYLSPAISGIDILRD